MALQYRLRISSNLHYVRGRVRENECVEGQALKVFSPKWECTVHTASTEPIISSFVVTKSMHYNSLGKRKRCIMLHSRFCRLLWKVETALRKVAVHVAAVEGRRAPFGTSFSQDVQSSSCDGGRFSSLSRFNRIPHRQPSS